MQGRTRRIETVAKRNARGARALPSAAVTWIGPKRALVVRKGATGVSISEVWRTRTGETETAPYLARIVDEIGDRDRVEILGPDSTRLELEREYVRIYGRPDRILDVADPGPTNEAELIRRLEELTSS